MSATQPTGSDKEGKQVPAAVVESESQAAGAQDEIDINEDDGEDIEEDSRALSGSTVGEIGSTLTSKQKKKKKSKAAAKLKKKLGFGEKAGTEGGASSALAEGSAGSSASGHVLSDEDVNQLQQAIEREQGPRAASKADRETLEKLMKMMNLERTAMLKDQEARQKQYKTLAEHKFWKTQPVAKPGVLFCLPY